MIKSFTDYSEVPAAKLTDYLLIHDGNGVKKISKENFMSEAEIALAIICGTYDGVDLTVKFADEIANYSDEWAWIQARLDSDDLSGLHIFDYIPIHANGETHEAQIAGINTYKRTGDTEIKTHIDWITRDCLSATVQWNTTNNNNGSASQANPFLASNVHSWLVGTVYPTLDAKLKAVIKDKRIFAPTRYQNGASLTDDNSWAWTTFDKLWLPLEGAIFDFLAWSTKGFGNPPAVQYPIFANSWKARIKGAGPGGERTPWWEASASSGNATSACRVDHNGTASYDDASYAIRVPVCFRTMAA